MEELCHVVFLVIMLTSILQLCLLLLFIFVQNFCYYWIVFSEVGMTCYWGNEVTVQAANIADAAADFDSTRLPLLLSKSLILVIRRSQKVAQLTAGKFVPLSMATITSILKGSFSYFTIMRQMAEK